MSTPTLSHWLKVTVPAAASSILATARKHLRTGLHAINYRILVALHFLHIPVAPKTLAVYQEQREFARILNDVPEKDRALYKALLRNQKMYDASRAISCAQEPVSFVGVVKNVIDNLTARHFVGCQPMTGPVGLICLLRYVAEAANEDGSNLLSLNVLSQAVEAKSRELQAKQTVEATDDFKTVHGLDIQKEIEYVAGLEIATNINMEIINQLHEISHKEDVEEVDDDMKLIIQINRACNDIGLRTRRGVGNFIVVDAPTLTRIETVANRNSLPRDMFVRASDEESKVGGPIKFAGVLNKTIKVYTSLLHDDTILVGYKGSAGEVDAGVFYAPYMLVMRTGIVIDSYNFTPIMKFLTRAGQYVDEKASDYYVTLNLPKQEPDVK